MSFKFKVILRLLLVSSVLSFSAKLRQSYVLPQNAAPEEQSKQRDAWTAAVIYAALVHDIGKVIVDIDIQLKDGSRWFPWLGVPTQPYKFKYIKGRDYDLHPVMGSFLANYLIPKEAFAWLAEYPEAFSALMYAMTDHKDKAGLLSEIVQKADQNSVTLALGGDVSKLTQKPITSFAKQLLMALRHLLQHKFYACLYNRKVCHILHCKTFYKALNNILKIFPHIPYLPSFLRHSSFLH